MQTALENLRGLPRAERGRVFQRVSALGVDPEKLIRSPLPSPGEARKLLIADALAREVWLLLLDEPTNHLDLPSIERLEEALTAYSAALVVISHDTQFLNRITDSLWSLANAELSVSST
jgi:ATPase subunit of ABC transporter with duplicated ATPase domains